MATPKAIGIELSELEAAELASRLRRRKVARADAMRAEIVLLAAEGVSNLAIAERLGITRVTARPGEGALPRSAWTACSTSHAPARRGPITDEKVAEVVTTTLETLPVGGRTGVRVAWREPQGWPVDGTAHLESVLAAAASQRNLQVVARPVAHRESARHRRSVSESAGSRPGLCVDEKSPDSGAGPHPTAAAVAPGASRAPHPRLQTAWHDFAVRCARLKAGTIIGKCMPRHRAAEFRRFLDMVEKNVPADLDVHVVMDNASSHKTKLIRSWFAKRPRWHVHFTPTSASWINQVERFFGMLTDDQIRRGTHRSVRELEAAIGAYIDARNADPKPFRWVKSADDILASIQRFCQRTIAVQSQCA